MRINKLSKSDSFDLYTQTLSNFLLKKEAQERINKLVKLASGLSTLFDFLVGGRRTITRGVDTGAASGRMAENIMSGRLYQEIKDLRGANGAIDITHPNYATVLGKLTKQIEDGSKALAQAFVDSGKFSPKMINLFFGTQDDLAKLFEVAYINRYRNSGSAGLRVVGEFPEILVRETNLAIGLERVLPVLKDENLNLLNEAIARSSGSGFDFLKTEPEDLAQLRGWLDADPRDVARIVEESRDVTRVRQPDAPDDAPRVSPDDAPAVRPDAPDNVTTIRDPDAPDNVTTIRDPGATDDIPVRQPGAPDDIPVRQPGNPDGALPGRRYTNEEIDDIIRRAVYY